MKKIEQVKDTLKKSVDIPEEKRGRFFKTGKGAYAQDDIFIGVRMPTLRSIAKTYASISLEEIAILMQSPIHEERMLALLILVQQYKKSKQKDHIFDFYMQYINQVNNWDLVDTSAHLIVGMHLLDGDKQVLLDLAQSENLWHRRIAIIATWWFIRKNQFAWTFKLATILLHDKQDLIHKAVGWMLREVGQRDELQLLSFLDEHAAVMPRTMLRYAIEKFDQDVRKSYLAKR